MTMSSDEKQKHIEWLQHLDIQTFLRSCDIPTPWFPAFRSTEEAEQRIRWFAALVPPSAIPRLVKRSSGWDIGPSDGGPGIWAHYQEEGETHRYCAFGNEEGIEPIVIWRSFHGIRPDFLELGQEFRLYHNLYPDPARKRFIHIDRNGDESDAARFGDRFMNIRTDLLRKFCAVKQMALAVYVESFRYSRYTLAELGLSETRMEEAGDHYRFPLAVVPADTLLDKKFKTWGWSLAARSMSSRSRCLLTKSRIKSNSRNSLSGQIRRERPFGTRATRRSWPTTSEQIQVHRIT